MNTKNSENKEHLFNLQAELIQKQAEIKQLQQIIKQNNQEINQLAQWLQSLQPHILAIYNSITWKIGATIVHLILKLLSRPAGITAQDITNKIFSRFNAWRTDYFTQQAALQQITWHDKQEYTDWIQQYDTLTSQELTKMRANIAVGEIYEIALFIIVNADNISHLQHTITSIQQQIYPHWKLYIAHQINLPEGILNSIQNEKRIQSISFVVEKPLANIFNTLLKQTNSPFIAIIQTADKLAVDALYQVVKVLNINPNLDFIYTDEDKIDSNSQRYAPHFKSDWNPDLFYSQYYTQHLSIYRCELINKLGGFKTDYPNCEEYDLTLRFIEHISPEHIYHIPHILYHQWGEKVASNQVIRQTLQAHFQRLRQKVEVVAGIAGHPRVIYSLPTNIPLVSLIIPTRDKLKLLRGTIDDILNKTDYRHIELIIVDNGSQQTETLEYLRHIQQDKRVRVVHHNAPFNYSQLNNLGVSYAQGEIIGLINNDLKVITSGWLTEMVSQALRPEIGAVGAKLYYSNDTIQHAGVIVGLAGMAGHGFKHLLKNTAGYQWRPFLVQNYSTVTAACLVMRRQIFEQFGGLNEKHLKVAYNDVDLCLRIREQGYRIVWTPYAELYHLESASRGTDDNLKKHLRLRHELNYMQSHWRKQLSNDPYYNPNLTNEYEDFSLAYPPRVAKI